MLINKNNLEIVKLAGKDDTRWMLNGVHFDPAKKVTVATDGKYMAMVSLPAGDSSEYPAIEGIYASPATKPFTISSESVKTLQKSYPKQTKTTLPILKNIVLDGEKTDLNGSAYFGMTDLDNPQVISARKVEGNYPNYEQVIPKGEPKFSIKIDPALLSELLILAMKHKGNEEREKSVTLEFFDSLSSMKIVTKNTETGQDFTAVLMPMR